MENTARDKIIEIYKIKRGLGYQMSEELTNALLIECFNRMTDEQIEKLYNEFEPLQEHYKNSKNYEELIHTAFGNKKPTKKPTKPKSTKNYVLRDCSKDGCWDGYYTGQKYTYQGGVYAVADRDINKAKRYSSFNIAKNACEKLNKSIENYKFGIEAVNKEEK